MKNNIDSNLSQFDFMYEKSNKYSSKTALNYFVPEIGKEINISYEEMYEKILKYAKYLLRYGLKRGDVVATCLFNTPESIYLLYALNKIGVVNICLNPLSSPEQASMDVMMTNPKLIISMDKFAPLFSTSVNSKQIDSLIFTPVDSYNFLVRKIYEMKNHINKDTQLQKIFKGNIRNNSTFESYIEDQTTNVMFTSGSTGVHKGVELTDKNFNESVFGMENIFQSDISPYKTHLVQIPIGHMSFGRAIMHYALSEGMTAALSLKPGAADFYDEMVRTKANDVAGGPPHFRSLLMDDNGELKVNPKVAKGSLSSVKFASSGGEVQRLSDVEKVNEAFKYGGSEAKLGNGLGATECTGPFIINNGRIGAMAELGKPFPSIKTKLVDPVTKQVNDKSGELHVSGPIVMKGYLNNEEETNKVMYKDEFGVTWYNTGDVVSIDGNNYSYVGRTKRNYVTDVTNIYPEQIEKILESFKEIREAIVVPIPDGERQYVSKYYISVFDENSITNDFENLFKQEIERRIHTSALPEYIEYTSKPLVRNASTKKDIKYYENDAQKELSNKSKVMKKSM